MLSSCYTHLMLSTTFYILSLIIIFSFATFLFFIAQIKKDNSIIDIAYGIGFIVASYILAGILLKVTDLPSSTILILILITLWGTRLAVRIFMKNHGKPEDFRYASWREQWNKKGNFYYYVRSYLQIFILQGIVTSIVLLPFTLSLHTADLPNHLLLFGLVIWMIGFSFEAVGDAQLDKFIKSKAIHKGTIMKTGLWKYTRHPNYFGESMMWFGIAFISLSTGSSYLVFLSPILITYLLLKVSGIPMLEKKWAGVPEWEVYKEKTSAFIPLPPKNL